MPKGKFNHYSCPRCGKLTISYDVDEGVTPYLFRCRTTPGCKGTAESRYYLGPQDPEQQPHVRWFRPASLEAALAHVRASGHAEEVYMRAYQQHYELGGLFPDPF